MACSTNTIAIIEVATADNNRWALPLGDSPFRVLGQPLTELELGPAARNIAGARMAAARISASPEVKGASKRTILLALAPPCHPQARPCTCPHRNRRLR
ncbi:hypothetical protein [Nitrosococcus oceani]|uniref:hypothetical protein n=1 Tax=Nitrosococcus oceani TaxID=1229 RepID=UPI0011BE805B|nr:hypothetical protein [Nitrosococcus oceani]